MRHLTMNFHRSEGKLDKNKILKRMQTLLNMVYLSADHQEDGSFKISSEIMNSIETELDFSPPEIKTKKAKEEEIKKRYRQRESYRFWKETLDRANIKTAPEAKDFLMTLYEKLERVRYFGSMSHANYALETLNLAIDDLYGTSSLVLHQYKHNLNKPKTRLKRGKKAKKKTLTPPSNADFSPF